MATKLSNADFVHLHNHTQYSLLDGLTRIPSLVDKVKSNGMKAVAMTDHGTMSGAIELYKTCNEAGIKPIIGLETYIASRKHTDKDPSKDKNRYHLILLAMNNAGYQNLMRLSSIANLDGFYYHPRIDRELLEKYNEGLIVLSGCMSGELGDALKNNQYDGAISVAKWYKKVFKDRYYLEVQDHGHAKNPKHSKDQEHINTEVLKISKELNIPAVVTGDAHYLDKEDEEAHEILLCVGTGAFLADEKRMSLKDFPLYVETPEDIISRWGEKHPDLITNTKKIADSCNVTIELGKYLIPKFPVPKGETEESYLDKQTYDGLMKRYMPKEEIPKNIADIKKALPSEVVKRAEYEIKVISSMGFNGYFLIVADFINWGKDQGIVFGPGRGSGAGSIIAYALKITELDPLSYDLLFERFLNPDRISMPDFDVDIQDTRRDEVINYCVEKYGKDRVANIVTFGRMQARNAVRDVARVLQMPYIEADRLAKMIPPPIQGRHVPLKQSIKEDATLRAEYESNEDSKKVLDQAVVLEGTIRSHGVHAAGVVIAPDEIVKFAPLEMAQKGVVTTQYSMGPVEELGLLKMDFLGLSNLTIIKNTLRIISKVYKKEINIDELKLDDKKAFELMQSGDTTGVFQLESSGMKRYLKDLKPDQFEDIIAMVSLYRPGPIAEIPRFIEGKHDASKIVYPHPSLEPILKNTYGVLVYQEQIISMLQLIAGYTPGQADLIRKAIGKKKREIMNAEHPKFIEGCLKQGLSNSEAEKLWAMIQPFADYSFNKAHAACYAMIAYQTAYLKAHYPDAFMAALMTSDFDNIDRLAIEITECRHMNIEVLSPDVNESFLEFAIVPGKKQIRFGLHAIKNVGANAVEEIISVREKIGGFKSIEDFFNNVNPRIVNRKSLESLIKCGAFDALGERIQLLDNMDVLLAYSSKLQKEKEAGQTDLFGNSTELSVAQDIKLAPASSSFMQSDQLAWERDLLGLYLSQHPLQEFREYLEEKAVPISEIKPEHDNKTVTIGGSIGETREITTKNGQKMAFIKLADEFMEIELVVFPTVYTDTISDWQRDKVVLVKGKVNAKDRSGNISDEIKMIVTSSEVLNSDSIKNYKSKGKKAKLPKSKIPSMSVPKNDRDKKIYIRLLSSNDDKILLQVKKILDLHPGDTEVILVLGEKDKQAVRLPQKISGDKGLEKLEIALGKDLVKIH